MNELTKEQAIEEIGQALASLSLPYWQHVHLQECLNLLTKEKKDV